MTATRSGTPQLVDARPLAEVLDTPVLTGASVLAGGVGLDRLVERLNVMEVPDILPWVKPHEFLLTTAYPLRDRPEELARLVAGLDDVGLAGLGIKLGRYLDRLPDDVIAVADARGFPLIQLPDHVSFDDIFNEVLTGILNRQAERLARSERIHRAFLDIVLSGHGLDRIAAELADLLGAPALVSAPDGQVLAHAGLPDPPGRVRLDGTVVAWEGGSPRPCLRVPVSAGGRVHGHVIGLRDRTEGTVEDRQALESAATVAALAITKSLEVQAVESKYRSDLMHDLLTGRITDPRDAIARARMFGWDLDRRTICLVLRLDRPPSPRLVSDPAGGLPLDTSIETLVTDRDPEAAVVRFSDEVVVLTAAFDGDDGRARARRFAVRLAREARRALDTSLSIGLSRPVEDLADVPEAYSQATTALRIGRDLDGTGAVAHFDDLGAYRILSLVEDVDELWSFAAETLGPLTADDEQTSELRRTLRALLEANGNVAEAARQLHVHYNTLRYRIEKLERMLGPFTVVATTRLDVHLALLILEMRSARPG